MINTYETFGFPLPHHKAEEIFGDLPEGREHITGDYDCLREIAYYFGGTVTDDNGSEFNHRVDEYTLDNGTIIKRHITRVVDAGHGIVENYWTVTK